MEEKGQDLVRGSLMLGGDFLAGLSREEEAGIEKEGYLSWQSWSQAAEVLEVLVVVLACLATAILRGGTRIYLIRTNLGTGSH